MKLFRLIRLPIARIAAVLTLFAVSPSAVRASCGDWLEHAETAASTDERPDDPQPPVTPCQGMACENSPNGPSPLSPSETRPPLPKEIDTGAISNIDSQTDTAPRCCTETADVAAGFPLRIDRPPEA